MQVWLPCLMNIISAYYRVSQWPKTYVQRENYTWCLKMVFIGQSNTVLRGASLLAVRNLTSKSTFTPGKPFVYLGRNCLPCGIQRLPCHGWPSTQPGTCTQPCPIVHTAVPPLFTQPCPGRTMSTAVYLRCRAVCKLSGCVEGHPCLWCLCNLLAENVHFKGFLLISMYKRTFLIGHRHTLVRFCVCEIPRRASYLLLEHANWLLLRPSSALCRRITGMLHTDRRCAAPGNIVICLLPWRFQGHL